MIRRCRIWLLGTVILALTTATSLLMAGFGQRNGETDSLLSALMTAPVSSLMPATRQQRATSWADSDAAMAYAVRAASPPAATELPALPDR